MKKLRNVKQKGIKPNLTVKKTVYCQIMTNNKLTKQEILNDLTQSDFGQTLDQIEDFYNLNTENKFDFEGWYLVFSRKLPKNEELNSLTLFTKAILELDEETFKVRLGKSQYLTYQEILIKRNNDLQSYLGTIPPLLKNGD